MMGDSAFEMMMMVNRLVVLKVTVEVVGMMTQLGQSQSKPLPQQIVRNAWRSIAMLDEVTIPVEGGNQNLPLRLLIKYQGDHLKSLV